MKRLLLFLLLALLVGACAKSYIDVRYSEPVIEKNDFSDDKDEMTALRQSFVQPLDFKFLE